MIICPCLTAWKLWKTRKKAGLWSPTRTFRAASPAVKRKKAWLEAALEDGVAIHEPDDLEKYSGQFKLRLPRSLHRALAEHSQQEGISMNQYCVYLLAKNDALHAG